MSELIYLKNVATLQLSESKCNGCALCVKVCPHEVFEISSRRSRIINIDKCMECGACAMNCEREAITVRSGVGCAAGILNGIISGKEASCGCTGESNSCC
jgi:NAD-dependent dihydropyrimidine dehydrogenase PreA subunit